MSLIPEPARPVPWLRYTAWAVGGFSLLLALGSETPAWMALTFVCLVVAEVV